MITREPPVRPPSPSALEPRHAARPVSVLPQLQPSAPPWVTGLMRDARAYDAGPDVQATARGDVAFLTTTVPDASRLDADGLRDDVARAYAKVGQALRTMGLYAVRWWNYLPDPGQMMAPGIDRYMVFNAGRHEGFRSFDRGANGHALATASAVGAATDDLAIHCLASGAVGHAVENPRQTPAWRYSPRYGPVPPSFSRATIAELDGRRLLLVGGTASVVGEDSMHAGDPEAQLEETFRNLAALVSTACRREEPPPISLARMKDLRVYLVRAEYASGVEALLRTRCPRASQVEVVPATLCRRELLIELEGIAEM